LILFLEGSDTEDRPAYIEDKGERKRREWLGYSRRKRPDISIALTIRSKGIKKTYEHGPGGGKRE